MNKPAMKRQSGAALLIMMLLLLVALTAVLVSRLDATALRVEQQGSTQDTLAMAREALLDYAAIRPDLVPSRSFVLPCPDIDDSGGLAEGVAHADACGASGQNVLGRLPWRTIGTPALRDSSQSCFWYVVSGAYKDATTTGAPLVNPDTNGQLQLVGVETGSVISGLAPAERPVAMIIAPNEPLSYQARAGVSSGRQCSSSFIAAQYLDRDDTSGISNAALSGAADVVDVFAVTATRSDAHNDRIAWITRADLERRVTGRSDYQSSMQALARAVALCLADYALTNPGGSGDFRLPWPAPTALGDYRPDSAYDDTGTAGLAGRLPDVVDDSSLATGNGIARLLSDCDPLAVPEWSPQMFALWRHWKDHFFYIVAEDFAPTASVPTTCSACLSVNGTGEYAAIVLFADTRLAALGQVRDAPPIDADTRGDVINYLEGGNAGAFPLAGGSANLVSQAAGPTFNDALHCIDAALAVSECPVP